LFKIYLKTFKRVKTKIKLKLKLKFIKIKIKIEQNNNLTFKINKITKIENLKVQKVQN